MKYLIWESLELLENCISLKILCFKILAANKSVMDSMIDNHIKKELEDGKFAFTATFFDTAGKDHQLMLKDVEVGKGIYEDDHYKNNIYASEIYVDGINIAGKDKSELKSIFEWLL